MPNPIPSRRGAVAGGATAPGKAVPSPKPARAKRSPTAPGETPKTTAAQRVAAGTAAGAALRRLAAANPEVARAVRSLETGGLLSQGPRRQVSARIDPTVLKAAGRRLGLRDTSDVINAALAVAAAPDPFKAWLRDPGAALPDDFELAV